MNNFQKIIKVFLWLFAVYLLHFDQRKNQNSSKRKDILKISFTS